MTRHQATCAERQPSNDPTHEVYRFRVSGADLPAYWLDVEVTNTATLDDLDGFLRGIWLEGRQATVQSSRPAQRILR